MPPKVIFLVPYRDRQSHYEYFSKHMSNQLDYTDEIFYIHQKDSRPFNRGALKNIGFLIVKDMYPKDYKNITLVFNDIDSMCPKKPNFQTTKGIVKHFYGFTYTLGGIVSINAGDFEQIGGFPNLWSWGYEDNSLQQRALRNKLRIDRSVFYNISDKRFIRLQESSTRIINKDDFNAYKKNNEGIKDIKHLKYDRGENGFIHVTHFTTGRNPSYNNFREYDLKKGNVVFDGRMKMCFL